MNTRIMEIFAGDYPRVTREVRISAERDLRMGSVLAKGADGSCHLIRSPGESVYALLAEDVPAGKTGVAYLTGEFLGGSVICGEGIEKPMLVSKARDAGIFITGDDAGRSESGGGGTGAESDPIYTADKPDLVTIGGLNGVVGQIHNDINAVADDLRDWKGVAQDAQNKIDYTMNSRGEPGGIATLGSDGKVKPEQLPALASGGIDYSMEEQDTGLKWIDGSPIYQKCFLFDIAYTSAGVEVHPFGNYGTPIGNIYPIDGFVRIESPSSYRWVSFPCTTIGNGGMYGMFYITMGGNVPETKNAILMCRYTK